MTTVNTEHLSRGWALIAEGAQYLSMAYASFDPPVPARETGVPASPAEGATGGAQASPPPSSVAPDFPPLPPLTDEDGRELLPATAMPPLNPQVEAGLGRCPVHGKPWTVKAAGVGAKGPYDAFWKCAERDDNGYCKQKPQKIWRDIHPLPTSAAA